MMALCKTKDIVYPDRINLGDLLRLPRALAKIRALLDEQLQSFREIYLPLALNHPHPTTRDAVEQAIGGGD